MCKNNERKDRKLISDEAKNEIIRVLVLGTATLVGFKVGKKYSKLELKNTLHHLYGIDPAFREHMIEVCNKALQK